MHRLDWGHGPNVPVPMYTEEEIRTAWMGYVPANGHEVRALAQTGKVTPLNAEQLIAGLKQGRSR